MVLGKLRSILRHKKYKIYIRPYELNIIGLRSASLIPNRFDDEIHVFYKINSFKWNYHVFKATTDPGTFWLKNPMQEQGTAILSEGQYIGAYELGLHQGKYKALVQRKPVAIIRDYDRDALLDFMNGHKMNGMFGINIHRASKQGSTKYVDKYSAGCQVFENAEEFEGFLKLCEYHRRLYGNVFTYTLIDFRAVRRENLRRILIGSGLLSLISLGYYFLKGRHKTKSINHQINEVFRKITKKEEKADEKFIQSDTQG